MPFDFKFQREVNKALEKLEDKQNEFDRTLIDIQARLTVMEDKLFKLIFKKAKKYYQILLLIL